MSFAVPEAMREYIDERVRSGEYGNTSEYLRDLVRRDQAEQATRHFRSLIADGLESGTSRTVTAELIDELREASRDFTLWSRSSGRRTSGSHY